MNLGSEDNLGFCFSIYLFYLFYLFYIFYCLLLFVEFRTNLQCELFPYRCAFTAPCESFPQWCIIVISQVQPHQIRFCSADKPCATPFVSCPGFSKNNLIGYFCCISGAMVNDINHGRLYIKCSLWGYNLFWGWFMSINFVTRLF